VAKSGWSVPANLFRGGQANPAGLGAKPLVIEAFEALLWETRRLRAMLRLLRREASHVPADYANIPAALGAGAVKLQQIRGLRLGSARLV
jgi:hypothetical protein